MFLFSSKSRTELCDCMLARGSDKAGHAGKGRHNYTPLYTQLFSHLRYSPLKILELGFGANGVDTKSNAGLAAKPGASLYGWSDYFPRASVYGADGDRSALFSDAGARIKTYWVDQTSKEAIAALWASDDLKNEMFDIIIDDGLPAFDAKLTFFENSIHKLSRHGFYVIEDVAGAALERWVKALSLFTEKQPLFTGQVVQVANPVNQHDNNLVLVRYARELKTVAR
jgi:hypothetical protein